MGSVFGLRAIISGHTIDYLYNDPVRAFRKLATLRRLGVQTSVLVDDRPLDDAALERLEREHINRAEHGKQRLADCATDSSTNKSDALPKAPASQD